MEVDLHKGTSFKGYARESNFSGPGLFSSPQPRPHADIVRSPAHPYSTHGRASRPCLARRRTRSMGHGRRRPKHGRRQVVRQHVAFRNRFARLQASYDGCLVRARVYLWNPGPSARGLRGVPDYYCCFRNHIMSLGRRLFPFFALALDLPEDYFDPYLTNPGSVMRTLYYAPQEGAYDARELGIGAHSDYELVTYLVQNGDVPALQVLDVNGDWVSVPPVPGTSTLRCRLSYLGSTADPPVNSRRESR